ncbi:ORF66-like protein [Bufonid herpesvirus 1]|uniref:ORF66-like protein n=1 Tax=Bufonid herpesvirus 1 TaxID=2282206 RepID=UPI000EB77430|nr:ORF66-like protein [Bufonid herpesvirus 1]AXF48574.1 ORF66-like protein [Bufonid herpesvirus 1]
MHTHIVIFVLCFLQVLAQCPQCAEPCDCSFKFDQMYWDAIPPPPAPLSSQCSFALMEYCGTGFPCIDVQFLVKTKMTLNVHEINPNIPDSLADDIYAGKKISIASMIGHGVCNKKGLADAMTIEWSKNRMTMNPCLTLTEKPSYIPFLPAFMAQTKVCAYPCPDYDAIMRLDVTAANTFLKDNMYCNDIAVCAKFIPRTTVCLTQALAAFLVRKCSNEQLLRNLITNFNPSVDFEQFLNYAFGIGLQLPFKASVWYVKNQLCVNKALIPTQIETCVKLVEDGAGCLDGAKLDALTLNDLCSGYIPDVLSRYNVLLEHSIVEKVLMANGKMANTIKPGEFCLPTPVKEIVVVPKDIVTRGLEPIVPPKPW